MEDLCLQGSEDSANILGRQDECVFPLTLYQQGESQESLINGLHCM